MSERTELAAKIAATAKNRVDARLGQIWWAVLLRGVLALALAIGAFVWPEKTIGLLVKLLGAYFLIDVVIVAVGAFRSADRTSPLLQAIVGLTIGLVLLLWTGISAKAFLILVGVWLILQGLGLFLSAIKLAPSQGDRGLERAIGGVMTLVGIVFVFWTNFGVVAVSLLIGFGALLVGGLLVFLATRVKRLRTRIDSMGEGS